MNVYVFKLKGSRLMQWVQDPSRTMYIICTREDLKLADSSGKIKKDNLNIKLKNLKLTVTSRILGTCIRE